MVVLDVFQSTFCEYLERNHGSAAHRAVRQSCDIDSDRTDVQINMGM